MRSKLVLLLWLGRMALEAAEVVVRGRRALDQALDNGNWRKPPWGGGGGGGDYWRGRG